MLTLQFCCLFYSVISKPFAYEYHWLIRVLFVALICVISIGVSGLPSIPFIKYHYIILLLLWTFVSAIVPGVIISIAYCLCARALKANELTHENSRAMQLRNKQNSRIVRMFAIVIAIYFLLTMPYVIYQYLHDFSFLSDSVSYSPRNPVVSMILHDILIAKCSVNPIIYTKLHREMNGYLRRIYQRVMRTFRMLLVPMLSIKRS